MSRIHEASEVEVQSSMCALTYFWGQRRGQWYHRVRVIAVPVDVDLIISNSNDQVSSR